MTGFSGRRHGRINIEMRISRPTERGTADDYSVRGSLAGRTLSEYWCRREQPPE